MNELNYNDIEQLRALVAEKATREMRAHRAERGASLRQVIYALDAQRAIASNYLSLVNKLEDATRI